MGLEIDREHFDEGDSVRFDRKLGQCLTALSELLARPGFGQGPPSIGAELEMDLVDETGAPFPANRSVLAETVDKRVTLEVNRFNLEVNSHPALLAGRPFSALSAELSGALAEVDRAAATHDARLICIGILPTLTEASLHAGVLTDRPRYRALARSIHQQRLRAGAPAEAPLLIEGEKDVLQLDGAHVTFEGANTSFQVHLRADPAEFARLHAAAQMATAPVLAAAGNSPLFLGRMLWEETRVALFHQSMDHRAAAASAGAGDEDDNYPARVSFGHGWLREGAWELFAESVALHEPLLPVLGEEDPLSVVRAGGVPALEELRLHHGTVWTWNRAVYDPHGAGHLRIELRSLPAGPTVSDMMANAAFLVGLTLALAPEIPRLLPGFTFARARRNFYQAARKGLASQLWWPAESGPRSIAVEASQLALRLLPLAQRALVTAGVEAEEAAHWLAIVEARVHARQTGAVWQRRAFEKARARGLDPQQAGAWVVAAYLERTSTSRPVHEWEPA